MKDSYFQVTNLHFSCMLHYARSACWLCLLSLQGMIPRSVLMGWELIWTRHWKKKGKRNVSIPAALPNHWVTEPGSLSLLLCRLCVVPSLTMSPWWQLRALGSTCSAKQGAGITQLQGKPLATELANALGWQQKVQKKVIAAKASFRQLHDNLLDQGHV